ncbi:hypothetical protein [Bacillus sp. NEAU-Y102]
MGEKTKVKKIVISAGELSAKDVFTEYLSGLPDVGEVAQQLTGIEFSGLGTSDYVTDEEYKDEELRLGLERLVYLGRSVLIVGDTQSGKTTLLKRLIRQKAATETGLAVIDEVKANCVEEVSKEIQNRGLEVYEDISILATLHGSNANFGLAQFTQYWETYSQKESIVGKKNPIDIVAFMEDNSIIGLFGVRKNDRGEDILIVLDNENTKVSSGLDTIVDKAIATLKELVYSGNRVLLSVYNVPERQDILKGLVYGLSRNGKVDIVGYEPSFKEFEINRNINVHSYWGNDWKEFLGKLNNDSEGKGFVIHDGYRDRCVHETLDYLAKGNMGVIGDDLSHCAEDNLLSFVASQYISGIGECTPPLSEDVVVCNILDKAFDKVLVVNKRDVTVYDMAKRDGTKLVK